jgi:hypothetical protein
LQSVRFFDSVFNSGNRQDLTNKQSEQKRVENENMSPKKRARAIIDSDDDDDGKPMCKKMLKIDMSVKTKPATAVTQRRQRRPSNESRPWVDKYRPRTVEDIIGQTSAGSCVTKLLHWLRAWSANNLDGGSNIRKRPAPPPWGAPNKNDDGASMRAALLSGAPGVGKTTSAQLCCQVHACARTH